MIPIVLLATPRTKRLLAAEEVCSSWNVWFLVVLFTIIMNLPVTPLAKPLILDAVVPVSLKKELELSEKSSMVAADGILVPSVNVTVPVKTPVGPVYPV